MIGARHLRIATQGFFLLAFLALFVALERPEVPGELASSLLALDPLAAVGTALSDWTVPRVVGLGLALLAATAVLGRFFCGWMCPLGTLQQLASWLAGPRRRLRANLNRHRPWFRLKYLLLAVFLVAAVLGVNHLGWLDPIPLLHRGVATGLRPLWRGGAAPGGWLPFALLAAVILASTWMPRFFCRALCPLGALLGLVARLAPLRIRRTEGACSGCTLCLFACQGADDPLGDHRVAECHVCLNCLDRCPDHSLVYGPPRPGLSTTTMPVDAGRRRTLLTVLAAAIAVPVARVAGGGHDARRHDAIRPPGALAEPAFLARCLTCGACNAACPTGVIVSDLGRTGIDGLFTPVLAMRRGWCEPSCIRCGEVCPTGAIRLLDPRVKQAVNGPAEVTVGTAFLDLGRCLPWAMDTPCIVCEEMCPTSPKAITLEVVEVTRRDGARVRLQRPRVHPELCTGCGLCENRCPVGEKAAIRVSAAGESRHPERRMIEGRRGT